jgi:two-component system, NarL family, nitrate/nitrite response regulator NarL
MRVLLVGRSRDRDRLRPQLTAAGVEIVSEVEGPLRGPQPPGIDAIVNASPVDAGSPDNPRGRSNFPRESETAYEEPLTARERDVLALVAEGLSNKAIAASLEISDQTVKFHVAAIISKLGAKNRTDAVRRAVRRGLVAI